MRQHVKGLTVIALVSLSLVATVLVTLLTVQDRRGPDELVLEILPSAPAAVADVFRAAWSQPVGQEGARLRVVRAEDDEADGALSLGGADAPFATTRLLANDPFLLFLDDRAGDHPFTQTGASLNDTSRWLRSLDGDRWVPLVVAGEEALDFAAFILYMAGETLGPEVFSEVLKGLAEDQASADAETVTEAELEALLTSFAPVVERLRSWVAAGILPFNWTNWDYIALSQAQDNGRAALSFQRRSLYKERSWQIRIHLQPILPPVAPDRRSYRLLGQGLALRNQGADETERLQRLQAAVLTDPVQQQVETETGWTPVALAGTPVNREHVEVVRWFRNAEEYVVVDPALASHPLFTRLRQLLR